MLKNIYKRNIKKKLQNLDLNKMLKHNKKHLLKRCLVFYFVKKLNKTKRQHLEYYKKRKYLNAWNISLKYSKILQKNIDKKDLLERIFDVYALYLNELQSNGCLLKDKSYILIWETVLNTINNHKLSEEFKKGSIRNLCYVNIKKNKK